MEVINFKIPYILLGQKSGRDMVFGDRMQEFQCIPAAEDHARAYMDYARANEFQAVKIVPVVDGCIGHSAKVIPVTAESA